MYSEPAAWGRLMQKLAETVRLYLRAQVEAGADALQMFDSWIGQLSPSDYEQYVLPYLQPVLQDVMTLGVPVIHFGTGTAMLLALQKKAGGHVMGVDFRTPLAFARQTLGDTCPLQGNLDPLTLFAPWDVLKTQAARVLDEMDNRSGHVFNLGHGILPGTPVENVKKLVEFVHSHSKR
jgi:uroporphyrinogen decarboxylase